jgi:hypothetical protein
VRLFPERKTESLGAIEIVGDAEFCARTRAALELLSSASCFEIIRHHIARVKQGKRSGMKAWAKKPTFVVGKPTWQHSVLWYAGAIAHDAYHSKLYSQAKTASNRSQPGAASWAGSEAEKQCLVFQRQVLIDLNAGPKTIAYIDKLLENPTYQGRNSGFGGWVDYLKRWW